MNLTLIPTHPDKAGGLASVGASRERPEFLSFRSRCDCVWIGEQIIFGKDPLLSWETAIVGVSIFRPPSRYFRWASLDRNYRQEKTRVTLLFEASSCIHRNFSDRWIQTDEIGIRIF